MPSEVRLKKLKICQGKHAFCSDKYSQKYFPCVSKIFPVLQQNSLCFPCLEKVRTKFPVFPVPWPPCRFLSGHLLFMVKDLWRKTKSLTMEILTDKKFDKQVIKHTYIFFFSFTPECYRLNDGTTVNFHCRIVLK